MKHATIRNIAWGIGLSLVLLRPGTPRWPAADHARARAADRALSAAPATLTRPPPGPPSAAARKAWVRLGLAPRRPPLTCRGAKGRPTTRRVAAAHA